MVLPDHYANVPVRIYLPPSLLAGLKDLHHRNWKHGALVRKREPARIRAHASLTRRSKL